MELPEWFTLQNVLRAVVIIFAMVMHYYFITKRIAAANEEAIRVLENMPEVSGSGESI